MISLNSASKRVTWRLDDSVHVKLSRIAKASKLTLEEVGNLILKHQDWDVLKPHMQAFARSKVENEKVKKQAAEALSKHDPSILNKIAEMPAEELAKLLGG